MSCEERKRWKQEYNASEFKTEQWKETQAKKCPKCETFIEKAGGN